MANKNLPDELKTNEDREIEHRVRLARAWLGGYMEVGRSIPNLAYIEAHSEKDRTARMALAQLLVDGNAPRDVLELLASCIAPDFHPPDDVSLPARGEPIIATDNPMRLLNEHHQRRLDFTFRRGKRRRGAPQQTDPYRDGAILQRVMEKIADGTNKTTAFREVAEDVRLEPDSVRAVWTKYGAFVEWWEAERNT